MAFSNPPMARRILALWFPRLATDRIRRCETKAENVTGPLAIITRMDNALCLSAVDRSAAMLGLTPGMTLATARAMWPDLRVEAADEAADQALLGRIADWCDLFSPFVACISPSMLFLDLTGAAHLLGGEAAALEQICTRLMRQGFVVGAAIAGTGAAARALARHDHGTIVPAGEDALALAVLPVEALDWDSLTSLALRRAGLKTIAHVVARGRKELAARFGSGMLSILDQALGRIDMPLTPRLPLPDYAVEQRFAEPLVTETAVLPALARLAQRLCAMLEQYAQGARRLEARFFRVDGVLRRLAIETTRPLRNPKMIERLFREKLSALADPLDPGFGYDLIRLCALRVERLDAKALNFESTQEQNNPEIDALIDRLAARFGSERILAFRPLDTHIPERAVLAVPAQTVEHTQIHWSALRIRDDVPRRPLRLFAPPLPVDVVAQVPDGPPMKFRWRRVLHTVTHAEGPERIAMEWWRYSTLPPTRDYYRVEDDEGRRFWLFHNGLYEREMASPQWFIHGLFA